MISSYLEFLSLQTINNIDKIFMENAIILWDLLNVNSPISDSMKNALLFNKSLILELFQMDSDLILIKQDGLKMMG